MAASEEVLLIISGVKHRKVEGTMYMMDRRMAWQQRGKDAFTLSHMYADIKCQKVSPEGKEKIQLQVQLHDGSASTFHFANPAGDEMQRHDRDAVKELLQQLLPKFKSQASKELEEKNRLFQEDPELFQLYKELVVGKVISAEEFWSNYKEKRSKTPGVAATAPSAAPPKQVIGVSAAFLADINPQSDGANGLKYNLTADIIDSIFRTYPAVKQKYLQHVPHNLTETEFWTKFFQSHYFHRDRLLPASSASSAPSTSSSSSSKDLFAQCAKEDETQLATILSEGIPNPLLDLQHFDEDTLAREGAEGNPGVRASKSNAANANLIRRFNHHSTMVLKAAEAKASTAAEAAPSSPQPPVKKAKLDENVSFRDLEEEEASAGVSLNLVKADRFLHGPTTLAAAEYSSSEEIIAATDAFRRSVADYAPALPTALNSVAALSALRELSPGGRLMTGLTTTANPGAPMMAEDVKQELRGLYAALNELLRHFWSCFPVHSKFHEEKVVRMKATLDNFDQMKLRPFRERYNRARGGGVIAAHGDPAAHMEEMLSAANKKFNAWQSKRKR